MDEGPRRVRPPSREELLIEYRLLSKKHEEFRQRYLALNPDKKEGLYKHKQIQVEASDMMSDDRFTEFGEESAFLSDFGLSQVGSTSIAPQNKKGQSDSFGLQQKMDKLKFAIDQENQKIKALESMVSNKAVSVNKILNIDGDIDILRQNLKKEKLIIAQLEEKNNSVRKKLELYDKSLNKGVSTLIYSLLYHVFGKRILRGM